MLSHLVNGNIPYIQNQPELYNIINILALIRDSQPNKKRPLIQTLGNYAIAYQIDRDIKGDRYGLSFLTEILRDDSLKFTVWLGVKESLKQIVVTSLYDIQILGAPVRVLYKENNGQSLRGIPAHHLVERVIEDYCDGRIAVFPVLEAAVPQSTELYMALKPFSSISFSARTPFSPAQSVIRSEDGSRKNRGLLMVSASLARGSYTGIPIDDRDLAIRITTLVNERLARNGMGITCEVGRFTMFGSLMDIGHPPLDLSTKMGITKAMLDDLGS
ncbi:hypothetical protein SAMN02745216_05268 [Desulfatibacillum alkenivorans DSM 16219]|jgi:hypothetical protein|uniref:Uncharacterized protein n=1 Tax=Desulfatibacillum alkenivorans DSM 16219 TaxID=1121393 RepID=A0A1M7B3W3_9BACT|nr:hypothetical protein [Desulfatibacillum alkenivorans]SHL49660.1 hypothetical protein SAMN02745216_05268 [Desulfatibacillum alkenivorans DSM 16219]